MVSARQWLVARGPDKARTQTAAGAPGTFHPRCADIPGKSPSCPHIRGEEWVGAAVLIPLSGSLGLVLLAGRGYLGGLGQ